MLDFYLRLNRDIEKIVEEIPVKGEPEEEFDILYLMPMYLNKNLTKEEIMLIQSRLSAHLIDKVSRVFIMSIKKRVNSSN